MTKLNTTAIAFIFFFTAISGQTKYEKGYFIDNSDNRVECLIENLDWRNNPTKFQYRLDENSTIKTADLNSTKEFEIFKNSKYIRATVQIDQSSSNTDELSFDRNPDFKTETVFLKVIVEGSASLYKYAESSILKYFFNLNEGDIKALTYKTYRTGQTGISKNEMYKMQLLNELKCDDLTQSSFQNLQYSRSSLSKLFIKYNSCVNSDSKDYNFKKKYDAINLSIRPRVNNSSASIVDFGGTTARNKNTEFDSEIGFGIGLEFEYIMPFNNNKWSLFVEPTLFNYKTETSVDVIINGQIIEESVREVDYKSIEFPIGVRHYLFLNDDTNLFLNVAFVIESNSKKSSITFSNDSDVPLNSIVTYWAGGVGVKYKKFSLETRFISTRGITTLNGLGTDLKSMSFIVGYTFL